MGTTGVHGEKYPLFRTRCRFQLESEEAVNRCVEALRQSDALIRRRIDGPGAGWDWQSAWRSGNELIFFVNWYDFAYFMKYKEIFLGKDHARYSMDFGLNVQDIEFVHHRISPDGKASPFDEAALTEAESNVVQNLSQIEFRREYKK